MPVLAPNNGAQWAAILATLLSSVLLQTAAFPAASPVASVSPDTLAVREKAEDVGYGLAMLSENGKLNTPVKDSTYQFLPNSGEGVDVYIMDSGINQIDGLKGVTIINEFKCSDDASFEDTLNHGTPIAALITSGKYGSAKKANLYSYKIETDDIPDIPCTLRALGQIVDNVKDRKTKDGYKGSVINISSVIPASDKLESLIGSAIAQGISIVSTPGNKNDMSSRIFPCAYDDVICVGAVDDNYARWVNDKKNIGSGFGSKITVWAPGLELPSYANNGKGGLFTGTSYSAPLVAGVVATYYGWEGTAMNAGKAIERLIANAEDGLLSGIKAKSPNKLANNGYQKAGSNDDKPYLDAPPMGQNPQPAAPSTTAQTTAATTHTTATKTTATATMATATPSESCKVSYDFLFDNFNIWGEDWNVTKLGIDGAGLNKHISACDDLTDWHFHVKSSPGAPISFHARGHLPIGSKHCVSGSLENAGGPAGSCSGPSI